MKPTHETYEEWYDVFVSTCQNKGYKGNFLKETWYDDWQNGKDPIDVADEWLDEIMSESEKDFENKDSKYDIWLQERKTLRQ